MPLVGGIIFLSLTIQIAVFSVQRAEMDVLLQDLRYAVRKLLAAPAFTVAAVVTLAIGIGATTAIFSTVNATLLRPLPYPQSENLIALRTRYTDGRVTTGLVAAVEVARLSDAKGSIERAVGMSSVPLDVTLLRDNAPPLRAAVHFVGDGFFDVFGLPMTLGSAFTHEQQTPIANGLGPGPHHQIILQIDHRYDFHVLLRYQSSQGLNTRGST